MVFFKNTAQATNARHVGYDSWKPEGKYPEAQYLNNLPDNPSMLVSVQGESKVHESGSIDLQEFTSINKEHYYIDIANAGKNPFNYEITTSADWIKVTDTNGTVNTQDTVGVEVDFDSGMIYNKTKGTEYKGQAFPEFMQKIISNGGLINYINNAK